MSEWDFDSIVFDGWKNNCASTKCGIGEGCKETIEIDGVCYNTWEVNYLNFGYLCKICDIPFNHMQDLVRRYRMLKDWLLGQKMKKNALRFSAAGFNGWPDSGIIPKDSRYEKCKSCGETYSGPKNLDSYFPTPP